VQKIISKLSSKKIFKRNLLEFFLILFGGVLAAFGGYLIFNQHLFFGIISFLSFLIVNIVLSKMKQNTNIYGTSATPPPASTTKEGTLYLQYKN